MASHTVLTSSSKRGAVAVFLFSVPLLVSPTSGWAQPVESDGWTAPRTPWGAPDIGGLWNSSTVTPLERPEDQLGKEFLTEEEAAAIEQAVVDQNTRANAPSVIRAEPLPVGGNVGGYNNFWLDRGTTVVPTRRTSLIFEPANGRLPALTPEAQRRRDSPERQRLTAIREGRVPADSYDQLDLGDRCIWYRGVPSLPTAYNNNYHLFQTPEHVVILQEHIHDIRVISLAANAQTERWSSRPPISATKPICSHRALGPKVVRTGISQRTSGWSNASRALAQARWIISLPSRIRTFGRNRGLGPHRGHEQMRPCLSTRATKAITA